jgi:glycosyltransferase involved in cell wall biosynthesis
MIVTIHDVFHLAMPKHVGGKHKYLYAEFLFNMVKQKAKKILTVSEFTKLEIQKYLKIPAERICPVHLAADESWFNIPVGERPYERPYIFFVGNVKWHKNILTLLKAFNVVKNDIDCDLVIIGKKDNLKTPDKTLEEEYAKGNGRIVFTGFVSDSKLKQYYKHALFMVFPSRYEGFGLPLLEAMAAGCLVLSSNAASLPEVGGNKVEYFNPNDSIELSRRIVFLYKNRKNLNNKINNGVEYAKLFSWDKCARTTMDNIYDCINE